MTAEDSQEPVISDKGLSETKPSRMAVHLRNASLGLAAISVALAYGQSAVFVIVSENPFAREAIGFPKIVANLASPVGLVCGLVAIGLAIGAHSMDKRILFTAVLAILGGTYGALVMAVISPLETSHSPPPNEGSVITRMQEVTSASIMYASKEGVFPNTATELIDSGFLSLPDQRRTQALRSYSFEMRVEEPDLEGQTPNLIQTARPKRFQVDGWANFFTDTNTGVIRYTIEDRPATASDPPVPK